MLNTYKTYNNTYHPDTIEVTEKRAPTDSSVKLLMEMEDAAMNKIIAAGKVEDNVFNVKWYIFADRYSWEDCCKCVFTLNGKQYDFQFRLPSKYTATSNILPDIKEQILTQLTNIFVGSMVKECETQLIEKYKR